MNLESSNNFKSFIQKLKNEPLWFKQALLIELKDITSFETDNEKITGISKEESLLMFVPEITDMGKQELVTRARKYDDNVYTVLASADASLSLLEVCINNNWCLSDVAKLVLEAIDNDLLSSIDSAKIRGTALYLSDRIRIGEYFLHLGVITMDQLDEALKSQKYIKEAIGEWKNLGEILLSMSCVTEEDIRSIQVLKEECKKLFTQGLMRSVADFDVPPTGSSAVSVSDSNENISLNARVKELEAENGRLLKENNLLKEQLRKILKIGK